MQTLLLPAARSAAPPPSPAVPTLPHLPRRMPCRCINGSLSPPISLAFRFASSTSSSSSFSSFHSLSSTNSLRSVCVLPPMASSPDSAGLGSSTDESDHAKLAQRLENTARYFKRLGTFGFWGQLVCTVVAAVILSFCCSHGEDHITCFLLCYCGWNRCCIYFGLLVLWLSSPIRKLRKAANEPSEAPPHADVVKSLKNGMLVNRIGMGAAILMMQATVGLLVAKALSSSATPYYQGLPPGSNAVLPLDVFSVQASANTVLSHFFGLVSSLERSVTLPPAQPARAAKMA